MEGNERKTEGSVKIIYTSQQSRIAEFAEEKGRKGEKEIEIFVDNREKIITKLLKEEGINVIEKQLDLGDFLISDRTIVERKTVKDFEASIIDGRLFEQASRLEEYEIPIVIIEGELIPGRISRRAFFGALVSLIIDFHLQLLFSKNEYETKELLLLIAKHEQQKERRPIRFIEKRKALTLEHQQLRVLQAFPDIGPVLAKRLINNFKSLSKIFNADEKELSAVIGKAKAEKIKKLICHSIL